MYINFKIFFMMSGDRSVGKHSSLGVQRLNRVDLYDKKLILWRSYEIWGVMALLVPMPMHSEIIPTLIYCQLYLLMFTLNGHCYLHNYSDKYYK